VSDARDHASNSNTDLLCRSAWQSLLSGRSFSCACLFDIEILQCCCWEKIDWRNRAKSRAQAKGYAIAYFTYCLLVVAGFQLYRGEQITRDVERAHVFAKIDIISMINIPDLQVNIYPCNTGRSPAIIKCIAGQYATEAPGLFSSYKKSIRNAHDWILASQTDTTYCDSFATTNMAHAFFYGFIIYEDIFSQRHASRFSFAITRGSRKLEWAGNRKFNRDR
jgi:hypothetical protein